MSLPFQGLRVVEFGGLGAAPFACSLMADAGADVVRIERTGATARTPADNLRGRRTVELNLKSASDREEATDLASCADVLVEAFRPGVMERLNLGPEIVCERNPRLIYARMTGWGQEGPRAHEPGHDLNYLAITGVARSIARQGENPVPPLNIVGDYGGGLMLAWGIALALFERTRSGRGQTIDAAMVDAATLLMSGIWQRAAEGKWAPEPGTNDIDSGAPFYNTYRTADGEFMAVGCIEPKFYETFLATVGLEADLSGDQWDRTQWAIRKTVLAQRFGERTRAEWTYLFRDVDACVTPINRLEEAPTDDHMTYRGTLEKRLGSDHPAPAPRLSRTPMVAAQADDNRKVTARDVRKSWHS